MDVTQLDPNHQVPDLQPGDTYLGGVRNGIKILHADGTVEFKFDGWGTKDRGTK